MDYIPIVVVHSRGMYTYNGYHIGGAGLFHFFAFMHSLKNKWFRIWVSLKPYCGGKDLHRESTTCK